MISTTGETFCDVLFANPYLKKNLLYKKRIGSVWEQILFFRIDPFLIRIIYILTELYHFSSLESIVLAVAVALAIRTHFFCNPDYSLW